MIEVTIRNYLEENMTIPVLFEKPKNVPSEYVLMELIDDGNVNHVNTSVFKFHCHGQSLYESAEIAETVTDLLDESISLEQISSAKIQTKSSVVDSATKSYKYEITYTFTYYRD